jgi:hypothetical protein
MFVWKHTLFEHILLLVVETKCLSYRTALFPFRRE